MCIFCGNVWNHKKISTHTFHRIYLHILQTQHSHTGFQRRLRKNFVKLICKIEFMLKKWVLYTPAIYTLLKLKHFDDRRELTARRIYSARQAVLTTANNLYNTVIIISFPFKLLFLKFFVFSYVFCLPRSLRYVA